ncbi:hypothetical protein [Nocardioides taihuensis]|uniref:Uncharacterized protein n=1 Tax=Nocardioides taihuensis TaxID=1835606 RepID=A0ABW0BPU4_9ACTN
MKPKAQARLKRLRAVELLAEGKSYDEIATEVGFAHRGSAHRAVHKALSEREIENIDLWRTLESERLDSLLNAFWEDALHGDPTAARTVLRVIDQRCRLLGLHPDSSRKKTDDGPAYLVVGPVDAEELVRRDDQHELDPP